MTLTTEGTVMVFKVEMDFSVEVHNAQFTSWNFGSCCNVQKYEFNDQYTERCCLAPGEYTLTCKTSYGNGWPGGFMEIQGHRYCDDFRGYKAMRRVKISGIGVTFRS